MKINGDGTAVALAEEILQKTWGFPHFRFKQEQAIARLIEGGSAVVVFPTGGGKSLVYQIPALAFEEYDVHCDQTPGKGVTLVVSPLIALMKVSLCFLRTTLCTGKDQSRSSILWGFIQAYMAIQDQVDALKRRGVCAAAMDSSQSRETWLDTCSNLRSGALKLL